MLRAQDGLFKYEAVFLVSRSLSSVMRVLGWMWVNYEFRCTHDRHDNDRYYARVGSQKRWSYGNCPRDALVKAALRYKGKHIVDVEYWERYNIEHKCPKCGSDTVEKGSYFKCENCSELFDPDD